MRDELGRWYADLGRFGELRRNGIDDGELVEFTLSWEEAGVPHAAIKPTSSGCVMIG